MTNKSIIIAVIAILVVGLAYLGMEVKSLRREVTRLTGVPSQQTRQDPPQGGSQFTQLAADDWWPSFNSRWDPYSEMAQIQREMNRLFRESFRGGGRHRGASRANIYNLTTDIKDAQDKYVINMDIPGMEKENINVEVKNNTLLVSGKRNNEAEQKNANYYKQERSFGYFSQRLPLPNDVNPSGISVNYKKGVLTIEIPKLAKANTQAQESTKIKVN